MKRSALSSCIPIVALMMACSSSSDATAGGGVDSPDGSTPSNVPVGAPCTDDAACNGGRCVNGACAAASATDGVKNGDETDVDCGGASAPKCKGGKQCLAPTDCVDGICTGGTCAAPSPTDGIKNGDETDVDCGGASAPKCAATKACKAATDCASGACRDGVCAWAPSCAQKNGGGTCGAGEVGDPNAKHEDCCVAITVPRPAAQGGPFSMDKYLITAGRMRVFLESVNYDVKGWIAANRPAWWTGSGTSTWDGMLPSNKTEFLQLMTNGGSGCFIGASAGQNGAPAYWAMPGELSAAVGGAPRTYTQAEMDTKVMNCFRAPLFHALCAFDHGRLPSRAEWIAARTDAQGTVMTCPWGTGAACADAQRYTHADYNFSYSWPRQPANGDTDLGGYLPAPGRFPNGYGPYGHADLLGGVENMGSQPAGGGGVTGDGWFQFSFQEPEQASHPYGQQSTGFGSGAYRNHWAVGARCVKLP